jgi:hypothetical protein
MTLLLSINEMEEEDDDEDSDDDYCQWFSDPATT